MVTGANSLEVGLHAWLVTCLLRLRVSEQRKRGQSALAKWSKIILFRTVTAFLNSLTTPQKYHYANRLHCHKPTMRLFSALLALPLIGAVLGKPVPVEQEDKRLLGLDNLHGGGSSSGSGSVGFTDLAGLLDQMNADLVSVLLRLSHTGGCRTDRQGPSFDILYGVRGEDANIVEGVLGNIKGTLEGVLDTIKNNAPGGQTASSDEM